MGFTSVRPPIVVTTYGSGGRPVNSTAFTPNALRDTFVSYSLSSTATITLAGGATNTAILETSPDGTTWTSINEYSSGLTGTLIIGVTINNAQISPVVGIVPAGFQCRIRTSVGTVTFLMGQEVQL